MVVKTCLFVIKDDICLHKYNEIQVKEKLNIKFNGVIKINFLSDEIPKEDMHYPCRACITIDSVMKMEKRIIHRFIQKSAKTK